ncbi:hypothetical protein TrVE_jg949 [Triparma verrucosa]|uniref:Uncharacterized protein n=1 Tax=Triparma verrucosa TaxID=1606542 RepID=A0A9W7FFZ3_9STRA|nr:hypothetical protein TrVE_jg949 [Triparma verrucosa]
MSDTTTDSENLDDWRSTFFVWRGHLISEEKTLASICEGDTVIWEGSWLPSVYFDPLTSDPPSHDPFKTTSSEITTGENKFRVSVSCSPKGLSFEGTYVLDNGDGFESKSDEKNIMDSYTKTVYFGSGMTEFGPFVTLSCEKDGVLTVVRRYVSEKDARKSGWTEDAKDLLEASRPFSFETRADWEEVLPRYMKPPRPVKRQKS